MSASRYTDEELDVIVKDLLDEIDAKAKEATCTMCDGDWTYDCPKCGTPSVGECGWCGRFGPIGKACIRKVPGTDEIDECGTFR